MTCRFFFPTINEMTPIEIDQVGSEEKIHVYYAHGEEGLSNLQRRAYWLLDKLV